MSLYGCKDVQTDLVLYHLEISDGIKQSYGKDNSLFSNPIPVLFEQLTSKQESKTIEKFSLKNLPLRINLTKRQYPPNSITVYGRWAVDNPRTRDHGLGVVWLWLYLTNQIFRPTSQ